MLLCRLHCKSETRSFCERYPNLLPYILSPTSILHWSMYWYRSVGIESKICLYNAQVPHAMTDGSRWCLRHLPSHWSAARGGQAWLQCRMYRMRDRYSFRQYSIVRRRSDVVRWKSFHPLCFDCHFHQSIRRLRYTASRKDLHCLTRFGWCTRRKSSGQMTECFFCIAMCSLCYSSFPRGWIQQTRCLTRCRLRIG